MVEVGRERGGVKGCWSKNAQIKCRCWCRVQRFGIRVLGFGEVVGFRVQGWTWVVHVRTSP